MEALSRSFRALGDASRLRLLRLLARTPLNVSELVSLVGIAQPSVSHHLGKLRALGLVKEERQSGFTYYSLAVDEDDAHWPLVKLALDEPDDGEGQGDLSRLAALMAQREDRQALNDKLLEPGQSFQLWSRALGTLLPRIDVADLGCGSGALTVEVARWAKSVLAVDRSEAALAAARERVQREGVKNVELLAADLTQLAGKAAGRRRFDLAIASQSLHFAEEPVQFVRAAHRLLKPGGRLLVLELLPHGEEWVKERLGHRWLGFQPEPLSELLGREGFAELSIEVPAQSANSPFRVFLLTGVRK